MITRLVSASCYFGARRGLSFCIFSFLVFFGFCAGAHAQPSLSACATLSVDVQNAERFPEKDDVAGQLAEALGLRAAPSGTMAQIRVELHGPVRGRAHATDEPLLFAADETVTAQYAFWDERESFLPLRRSYSTQKTVSGNVSAMASPWTKARASEFVAQLRSALQQAQTKRSGELRVDLDPGQTAFVEARLEAQTSWQPLGQLSGSGVVRCLPSSGTAWFRLRTEDTSSPFERSVELKPGTQTLDARSNGAVPGIKPTPTKSDAGDKPDPDPNLPTVPEPSPEPRPTPFGGTGLLVLGLMSLLAIGLVLWKPWARRGLRIFLSYRRDDTAAETGRLRDWLQQRQGVKSVYMDVSQPSPGEDYRQRILRELSASNLVLVCIGKDWLKAQPGQLPRLHNDDDWVRFEIATALQTGKPTVPLLFDDAGMPSKEQLPDNLKGLAYCQAVGPIRNAFFETDAKNVHASLTASVNL